MLERIDILCITSMILRCYIYVIHYYICIFCTYQYYATFHYVIDK